MAHEDILVSNDIISVTGYKLYIIFISYFVNMHSIIKNELYIYVYLKE